MRDELRIPEEKQLPPGRLMLRKEHLMRELSRSDRAAPGNRRRWLAVVAPVTVLAMVAAGYAIVQPEPTEIAESVACYKSAERGADIAFVGSTGESPVDICAGIWADGDMIVGERSVPPLVACAVVDKGNDFVAVIPSSDRHVCAKLEMAELPEGYEQAAKKFAQMSDAIQDRIGVDRKCTDEADARRIVQEELDSRGFSEWSVERGATKFGDKYPCANVGFDLEREVVVLVAGPALPSPSPTREP